MILILLTVRCLGPGVAPPKTTPLICGIVCRSNQLDNDHFHCVHKNSEISFPCVPVRFPPIAEVIVVAPEPVPEQPYVRELFEIGNFTRIDERDHVDGFSKRAFLVEPSATDVLNWDLNVAFDSRKPKDPTVNTKIDHLLRWITENFHIFQDACGTEGIETLHTDFVCYRSLLAKIMCSVHENSEGWLMGATNYRETIYLCEYKPNRQKLYTDEKRRNVAWRHKFEQYMTAARPHGRPCPQASANETEVTYEVARTQFNKHHSIILAARVTATDGRLTAGNPEVRDLPGRFVELRTTRRVDNQSQQLSLFRKMSSWWCKAHLLGVPRVICGYRDDKGIVESVRSYKLQTLEELGRPVWKSADAVNFLSSFLQFVQENNYEEDRGKVVLYEFNPDTRIIKVMVLPRDHPHFRKYQVLPDWYLESMEERFYQPY